jgi:hypothetical protein
MGCDFDAKLMFGWRISTKVIDAYVDRVGAENAIELFSTDYMDGSFSGLNMVYLSPFRDEDDYAWYLTIFSMQADEVDLVVSATLGELQASMSKVDIARHFMINELGCKPGTISEPQIFLAQNIW